MLSLALLLLTYLELRLLPFFPFLCYCMGFLFPFYPFFIRLDGGVFFFISFFRHGSLSFLVSGFVLLSYLDFTPFLP